MKLDVGSGECEKQEGCINLDSMESFGGFTISQNRRMMMRCLDVRGDARVLPFKDMTFEEVLSDSCVMTYVFERAVKECWRVLKRGGRMELYVYPKDKERTIEVLSSLENAGDVLCEEFNHDYDLNTGNMKVAEWKIEVIKVDTLRSINGGE